MKRVFAIAATALLTLGGTVRAQMPADSATQVVDTLYRHYLGRVPDPAGYRYWVPRVATRQPQQVLASMLASEEYWNRNGASPDGLVLGLYRDVLARTRLLPQDVGYWVNKMNQYGDRRAMIQEFLRDANVDVYNPPAAPAVPPPPPAPAYPPPAPPAPVYPLAPPAPPTPVPAPQYTPSPPVLPSYTSPFRDRP
jgi:hypothetical protein